jgi:hypothetical protein
VALMPCSRQLARPASIHYRARAVACLPLPRPSGRPRLSTWLPPRPMSAVHPDRCCSCFYMPALLPARALQATVWSCLPLLSSLWDPATASPSPQPTGELQRQARPADLLAAPAGRSGCRCCCRYCCRGWTIYPSASAATSAVAALYCTAGHVAA